MSVVPSTDSHWRNLHEATTAPYRRAGAFAWHFARGKLARDPVFRGLIEQGLIDQGHVRVLDVGCGQGLFASLLSAMSAMQAGNEWPSAWAATPAAARYTGVELMMRDVERAARSVGDLPGSPSFACADMCSAEFAPCDLVVILDVLHYVDLAAQENVLLRVRDALRQGSKTRDGQTPGRLLLRVGDAADRRGYLISQWVDRSVTRIRGHRVAPTWGRPLVDWVALLERIGFAVKTLPMSRGTPFANVLLVADLKHEE